MFSNIFSFLFFLKCSLKEQESTEASRVNSATGRLSGRSNSNDFWNKGSILDETRNLAMNGKRVGVERMARFLAEPGVRTTRGRRSAWAELRHFKDTSKMCSFQFESSLSIYEYKPDTLLVPCSVSHWEGPWWHRLLACSCKVSSPNCRLSLHLLSLHWWISSGAFGSRVNLLKIHLKGLTFERIFSLMFRTSLIFNKLTFHSLLTSSSTSRIHPPPLLLPPTLPPSQMRLLCYLALTLLCALWLSWSEAAITCSDTQRPWPVTKPTSCCNKCPPGSLTSANFVPWYFLFSPVGSCGSTVGRSVHFRYSSGRPQRLV